MAAHSPVFHADPKLCRGDGVCVEVCPKDVLEVAGKVARVAEGRGVQCFGCGHCVAVCPNLAASLEGAPPMEFVPRVQGTVGIDALLPFLESRRSVRVFRDEPVERAMLDRIVKVAGSAPIGFDPTTEITILDRREDIDRLAADARAAYAKLLKMHANPVARAVIRLKRGAETAHSMRSHVLGIVQDDNAQFAKTGDDRYLYRAPVVLLFHSNRWETAWQENALIVATYAMLAAHAMGLGTTLLSIIPPLFNNFPGMGAKWGFLEDDRVVIAMIAGHPKYKFRRAIRRRVKSVRYLRA